MARRLNANERTDMMIRAIRGDPEAIKWRNRSRAQEAAARRRRKRLEDKHRDMKAIEDGWRDIGAVFPEDVDRPVMMIRDRWEDRALPARRRVVARPVPAREEG
jgi:hypothetical protein